MISGYLVAFRRGLAVIVGSWLSMHCVRSGFNVGPSPADDCTPCFQIDAASPDLPLNDRGTTFSSILDDTGIPSPAAAGPLNEVITTIQIPSIDGLTSIVVGRDGVIYAAASRNNMIIQITGTQVAFFGDGVQGFRDGPVATSQFNSARGVAVDDADHIWVADTHNHRIRKIANGVVSTVAGNGTPGHRDHPSDPLQAQFDEPYHLIWSPQGVYVAEKGNQTIRRITSTGQVETVAGDGTGGYRDGPASQARFSRPRGIAMDAAGRLIVGDAGNHVIRLIDGSTVSTFAGDGNAGTVDGPVAAAQFNRPYGVFVDGEGTIFVADRDSHKIRRIDGGMVTTVAGTGEADDLDELVDEAKIHAPYDLIVDTLGHLVFVQSRYGGIRMIRP